MVGYTMWRCVGPVRTRTAQLGKRRGFGYVDRDDDGAPPAFPGNPSTGAPRSFVRTARRARLTLSGLLVLAVPRSILVTTALENRMTSTRIAFLDVDGTILDHGKAIAPSTVAAIRGARAAGHLVYLCTGRAAGAIPAEVAAIGFDGAITNGGAYATCGAEVVVAAPMPRDAVQRLIAYFEDRGILFFLQTDAAVHASPQVQRTLEAMLRRWESAHGEPDEPQTAPQGVPRSRDLTEVDLDRVAKAVFLGESVDTVARAQDDLGDQFHIVPGSMPLPGGSNGEIGMRGTTKGSAIESVLDHLGIDRSVAIGIGDSWNDVEMFDVCGMGIAMGNAAPELKTLADESTTSVREDGVWNAFVRHGLVAG